MILKVEDNTSIFKMNLSSDERRGVVADKMRYADAVKLHNSREQVAKKLEPPRAGNVKAKPAPSKNSHRPAVTSAKLSQMILSEPQKTAVASGKMSLGQAEKIHQANAKKLREAKAQVAAATTRKLALGSESLARLAELMKTKMPKK